jgi:hypothetical protein
MHHHGDIHVSILSHESLSATLDTTLDTALSDADRPSAPIQPTFAPLAAHDAGRFVKLDAAGNQLPLDATDHAIVRDHATGLDWLVAYATPEAVPHAEAVTAAAAVRVAGHENWRLPERFELESILDLGRYNPAIDPNLFPGTKSAYHWTASPDASDPDFAWSVNFYDGHAGLSDRDSRAFARAVRVASARQ